MAKRLVIGGLLAAAVVQPAFAQSRVDMFTVSGRFELPKAAPPLAGTLRVGTVTQAKDADLQFGIGPNALKTTLSQSLQASLRNFGYLQADAASGVAINVELASPKLTSDKESVTATSRLSFTVKDGAVPACMPASAEGTFQALKPKKADTGGSWLATLAFSAVAVSAGYIPTGLVQSQVDNSASQNAALNARRVGGKAEGVAPSGSSTEMQTYAAINATQVAIADFINAMGVCQAAAAQQTAAVN